jgi:hypothetical protein
LMAVAENNTQCWRTPTYEIFHIKLAL